MLDLIELAIILVIADSLGILFALSAIRWVERR